MGREIPTCPRKLTVLCCVTSLCCYWVLWVIQCIWSSTLTTAAAPQQPERACNCAVDRVYLTIVIAVTSTYTHFNTISASHHSLKKNDWTLKLLKSFICPFFFQALLSAVFSIIWIQWLCILLFQRGCLIRKMKKNVNIRFYFNYCLCFCWYGIHHICLQEGPYITFFLIRIVFWNKQKILLLVFFPMFNALLFEYKCLWGLIRSEMCDTECNITAVAIAWLVWNWDKMPARISFTKQFECDSVRELARIYWIFSRMWKKNTN